MDWTRLADDVSVDRAASALREHGMTVMVVNNRDEARKTVLQLIPEGAEVMNQTSVTLDELGVSREIEESGRYRAVRKELNAIEDSVKRLAFRRRIAAIEYTVGSVHAVTEEGQVVIASKTGSQLSAYAYSAANVLWVVGTQKIVKDLDQAFRRIREHSLRLEDARARKVLGTGSSIGKILVVEKEPVPDRIKIIFVKERLGF